MKPALPILVLLFFVFTSLSAQEDFKVIKVNGSILVKQRNVSLETGTVFNSNEELLFRTEDATAAVINSQKGRVVITSRNHDLSAARPNAMPSMYNISSRGGALLTGNDLSNHFSGRYVVLGKQGVKIEKSAFPMNKDNFFFLRYKYKGEDINKKLPFSNDTVFIDKETILTVDGKPITNSDNSVIRLYYRKGNESLFLSEFDLIFPDETQLKKEIGVILDEVRESSANDKISEAGSYITEYYGKIQKENLSVWLKKYFGIK